MNLYDYITPVVRTRTVQFLAFEEEGIFKNIVETNIDQILSKNWIQHFTETVIDEMFEVFYKEKSFENLDVDISEIKNNFLGTLEETELEEGKEEIGQNIPDSIKLNLLLGIEENDFGNLSGTIIGLKRAIKWGVLVLGVLIFLIILIAFLAMKNSKAFNFLLINVLIVGLLLFSLPFGYKYLLLGSEFLTQFMSGITSTFVKILTITSLTFLDRLTRIWSFVGIILMLIVIGIKMIRLIITKNENTNRN